MEIEIDNRKQELAILKDFINRLPKLHAIRKSSLIEERNLKLLEFKKLTPRLNQVYNRVLKREKSKFLKNCQKSKHILTPTSFEIMNRHLLEETHSNVISYLIGHKAGPKFLQKLIEHLDITEKDVWHNLLKEEYLVKREYYIMGKRIDIWIESRNFVIVVENKFFSKLNIVEDVSQTDFYYRYVCSEHPNIKRLFILLDFKGTEACNYYELINYKDILFILQSLDKYYNQDLVYFEYVVLLKRLLSRVNDNTIKNIDKISYLSSINRLNKELLNGKEGSPSF